MDHQARENFYVALDLDPNVDDWATIEARVEEKRREWSKHTVHGSPARQQEAKGHLKRIEEMIRRLRIPEERAVIRAEARKIKTARAAAARRRLDQHIELLRTKGYYRRDDLSRIHRDLGGELSESDIEEALIRSGLFKAGTPGSETAGATPIRPRINPTIQSEIRRLLDQLGLRSLYDLLALSRRTDLGSLSRQADEVYRQFRPLTDPDSTARSKLAGHAKNLFSDAAEKAKYDNTVDVEAMNDLHGLLDSAGLNGLISVEGFDRLVRLAAAAGVKPVDAQAYIEEYVAKKKWLLQSAGRPPGERPKLCGYCSTLATAPTETKCAVCHEPLELSCPRCGTNTPTERERCGSCGFPTGSMPHLEALLRSGRRLIGEQKYEEAIAQLDRALSVYDAWEPAQSERQRARTALDAIAVAERDLASLVEGGRLVEASGRLPELERTWGPVRWAGLRSQIEGRLSQARDLLVEAERLLRAGDGEAAWLACEDALTASPDLEPARAVQAKCPPPPPTGLEITSLPSGFGLAWSAPTAGGQISYRLLRKEGSAPRDPEDGTVLPSDVLRGATRAEDVQAPAGRAWHYAVFTVRDGVASRAGTVAGPVTRTLEVEALRASIGDRRATLTWTSPVGARSVEVRRRIEATEHRGLWGPPLAVRPGDSRFTDTGLQNEVTYRYRVAAVFSAPGGSEITSPGREVLVTPSAPPGRVVDLAAQLDRTGLRIAWDYLPDSTPCVLVIRAAARPSWDIGQLLPLATLSSLGSGLVEVGEREARDPSPDPSEAYYYVFATNRLLAAYCGAAHFAEVRDLYATREDGQIVLRWAWPDECTGAEIMFVPAGPGDAAPGTSRLVHGRSGQEPNGLVRLPIDGLAPGRRTFRVRCLLDADIPNRVTGPGRAVDELVFRSRELRWALKRLPFGVGPTRLLIESEDLSGLERIRLVGKVNERPASPDDGYCLVDWRSSGQPEARPPLVQRVGARRDRRGETFCRLFLEPPDLVRVDDPPLDRTIL